MHLQPAGQAVENVDFLRAMEAEFRRSNLRGKAALVNGAVVAVLQFTPEGAERGMLEFWGVQPHYLHMSAMSLAPYEPMLQVMTEATEDEREVANAEENEIVLKANINLRSSVFRFLPE